MRIRPATEGDVPALLSVKESLRLRPDDEASTSGGFLLGTDADGYRQLVRHARTWVLDDDGRVQGLAVLLPDPVMRASDVWARRDQVAWEGVDVGALQDARIGYFDQLAVRRGGLRRRAWAAALALTGLNALIAEGHELVFATTVAAPVLNLAAVPWLNRLGARQVGRIDEVYPDFGPLVSHVWMLESRGLADRLTRPRGLAERWVIDAAAAA